MTWELFHLFQHIYVVNIPENFYEFQEFWSGFSQNFSNTLSFVETQQVNKFPVQIFFLQTWKYAKTMFDITLNVQMY